jgi:hypothetical protein
MKPGDVETTSLGETDNLENANWSRQRDRYVTGD